jgi:hypothetical protein
MLLSMRGCINETGRLRQAVTVLNTSAKSRKDTAGERLGALPEQNP